MFNLVVESGELYKKERFDMRTILLTLLLLATMTAYHFMVISWGLEEQIVLLHEQVGLAVDKGKAEQNIAWLMSEGVRTCSEELSDAPRWLGLFVKKPEIVASRYLGRKKIKTGIGGP
jgi:hypothetical protein